MELTILDTTVASVTLIEYSVVAVFAFSAPMKMSVENCTLTLSVRWQYLHVEKSLRLQLVSEQNHEIRRGLSLEL